MKRRAHTPQVAKAARAAKAARPSGRFVLRIEPEVHAALQLAAQRAGLSLNEYCGRRLALPCSVLELEPAAELVKRALAIHGDPLLGVVLFGSWVRGEAGPSSDVDALIVLDSTSALTRALYHPWDESPVQWGALSVEPHLVQLPGPAAPGTVWAEAAIDGLVLFERDLRISRQLAGVRRSIAEGKLVRRTLHGQPYWAEVA